MPQTPWYRQRRSMIVGAGILAVVVIIIVSGIVHYALWQSSAEKVLLDSVTYAQRHPGTYHVTVADSDFSLEKNGRLYAASGKISGIQLEVVASDKVIYFKSESPVELIETFMPDADTLVASPLVSAVLPSIKDKWVKVSIDNLPMDAADASLIQCGVGLDASFADGNQAAGDFASAYAANQFISTRLLRESDDQSAYELDIDGDKMAGFFGAISETESDKRIDGCVGAANIAKRGDGHDLSFEITVSQPDHQLRGVTMYDGATEAVKITADYSAPPQITAPKDAVAYEQLSNLFVQSFLQSLTNGQ